MIGILGLWFRLTDPAATENYTYIPTVSLHEALPISRIGIDALVRPADHAGGRNARHRRPQHEHRVDRRHRTIAVVGYDQPRGLRRFLRAAEKIGRASCRERVWQYVEIADGALTLNKYNQTKQTLTI